MALVQISRSAATRLGEHLRESYALDYRSLAVFRILVALVILADLTQRFGNATVHYSDAGVLPRTSAIPILAADRWSILFASGSAEFSQLVILTGMVAAGMMLMGWHTRLATIVVWIVVVSLQARNNHLTYGGDTLMRLSLFWSMFLPLGSVWSFDSSRTSKPAGQTVVSLATFALIAQIAFMYLFTALLKNGSHWREDMDAVYYALGMRDLSTALGNWLFLNAPANVFSAFTAGTLWMELAVPIMLLLPIRAAWLRMMAVVLVLALHLGIGTTMSVGLFPAISIASMVAVLPSSFWAKVATARLPFVRMAPAAPQVRDRTPVSMRSVSEKRTELATDAGSIGFLPLWPSFRFLSAQHALNAFVAVGIILAMMWNVSTVTGLQLPDPMRRTAVAAGLYQNWGMFAPNPRTATMWFVVEGELASGDKIDLMMPVIHDDFSLQQSVNRDQSGGVDLGDERWRKYFHAIRTREDDRLKFAGYICRSWNTENSEGNRLETVTITVGSAATLPNSQRAEPAFEPMGVWTCS